MASLQDAKARFASAGFERSDRYEAGTAGKGAKWNSSKSRAKENWPAGVQAALQNKSFDKGLDKADASDYDAGIRNKGLQNWPTGLQAGQDKYAERITPFVPLWDASLPTPKGARRSGANMKRMTENVTRFISAAGK